MFAFVLDFRQYVFHFDASISENIPALATDDPGKCLRARTHALLVLSFFVHTCSGSSDDQTHQCSLPALHAQRTRVCGLSSNEGQRLIGEAAAS